LAHLAAAVPTIVEARLVLIVYISCVAQLTSRHHDGH
jgi:hypothetical protein